MFIGWWWETCWCRKEGKGEGAMFLSTGVPWIWCSQGLVRGDWVCVTEWGTVSRGEEAADGPPAYQLPFSALLWFLLASGTCGFSFLWPSCVCLIRLTFLWFPGGGGGAVLWVSPVCYVFGREKLKTYFERFWEALVKLKGKKYTKILIAQFKVSVYIVYTEW